MEFLHQALYVHEFGETSVLAERDGEIVAYLLGFIEPDRCRLHPRRGGAPLQPRDLGLGARLYGRFGELVGARGASALKAITRPGNDGFTLVPRSARFLGRSGRGLLALERREARLQARVGPG